jgi:N6-L-threonylcarbamoyladenine synthase
MRVLGIETSCDETAVAVVEDGFLLRSNVIASQVALHARYGGVVPEIASRQHLLTIEGVVKSALSEAEITLESLDAIAVTNGPGLAGALLVGVNYAKGLAQGLDLPLLGINHLEGHVYAAWLTENKPEKNPGLPLVCLIASGGHTDLLLMEAHHKFCLLGRSRDDAAGEAFDKAARILGLGFPGGPAIQRVAEDASGGENLPRAWLSGSHDFSFSGLKTALIHLAQEKKLYPPRDGITPDPRVVKNVAASFQQAVAHVLVEKTVVAAREYGARGIIMGGGVAANSLLRSWMIEKAHVPVIVPPPVLCTDNGAMIAVCASLYLQDSEYDKGEFLDVIPSLGLG